MPKVIDMDEHRAKPEKEDIRATLAMLFFLACGLILLGSIGDILVALCKYAGFILMGFVAFAAGARFVTDKWPDWATRACRKVSELRKSFGST